MLGKERSSTVVSFRGAQQVVNFVRNVGLARLKPLIVVMNPRIECGGLQGGHALFCKPWT